MPCCNQHVLLLMAVAVPPMLLSLPSDATGLLLTLAFCAFLTHLPQDEDEDEEEPEEEGAAGGVRTGGMDVDAGEEARDDGIPVQVRRKSCPVCAAGSSAVAAEGANVD